MSEDTAPSETPTAQFVQVPVNADGTIGTLPEPLQKLMDARISAATQRAKARTPDPVEHERLKTLEAENEAFRLKELEAGQRYEEASRIREEREAKERDRLQGEIRRREERLTAFALTTLRAEAVAAGARDESVEELVELLGKRVTLAPDTLDVLVTSADGAPIEGGIAGLVKGYLDAKPHHRRLQGGQPMGLKGGVAQQTGGASSGTQTAIAAIQADIARTGTATGAHLRALREARAGAAS